MRVPVSGWAAGLTVCCCLLAGCGAGGTTLPPPSATPAGPATPTGTVSVPADGVTLALLGFRNGPVGQFSIPRGSVLDARVDQDNNVTVVLSAPPPRAVADYLRRALPASGFSLTADNAAQGTLTFTGWGWDGSLTGSGSTSAVLLRPRP